MITRRAGLAGAVILLLTIAGRAQSPAGDVVLPAMADRPPVAMIVATADAAAALSSDLKLSGIASLTVSPEAGTSEEQRIRHLTETLMALRNDARFPIVIVIGQGTAARDAAVSARVARADGFVAVAAQDASAEIGRLMVEVFKAPDASAVKDIAEFARGLPPLGRRGTRERRPDTPRRSPRTLALGSIGGSLVGIEYGQPQKRGREIWGALVPWSREWMPGADEATTLTTSVAMRIGDIDLAPGDYTFYLEPRADRVQLLVSKDVGQFHTVFDSQAVIGRAEMMLTKRTDRVEGLTFGIDARGEMAGAIKLSWDDRDYSVSIAVGK